MNDVVHRRARLVHHGPDVADPIAQRHVKWLGITGQPARDGQLGLLRRSRPCPETRGKQKQQ